MKKKDHKPSAPIVQNEGNNVTRWRVKCSCGYFTSLPYYDKKKAKEMWQKVHYDGLPEDS